MSASEDELAKKTIQEAVWTWAGRIVVLGVTFGFGFFAAWVQWGYGNEGAPQLRLKVPVLEDQVRDLKNQRLDINGQLTVARGRQEQCERRLKEAQDAAAAAKSATPE